MTPTDTIKCELAEVIVKVDDHVVATRTVPAYTVPAEELKERIEGELSTYIARSGGTRQSLADFALYLLAQASKDPKEQPA